MLDDGAIAHVGVVVEDLAAAMRTLGPDLSIAWGRVQRRRATIETTSGPCSFESAFVLSLAGPLRWELIERRPDTPWAEIGLHHVARWCDDLGRAAQERIEAGWSWEAGKYYRSPTGVRTELVPRAEYEPRVARYVAGGEFFEPLTGEEAP
jgi:hypothetical protein